MYKDVNVFLIRCCRFGPEACACNHKYLPTSLMVISQKEGILRWGKVTYIIG